MSMEKAITSGKEHRKEYRGSKAIDCTCRNHGSCTYCLMNRLYKNLKKEEKMLDMEREFCYNNYRTKEKEREV